MLRVESMPNKWHLSTIILKFAVSSPITLSLNIFSRLKHNPVCNQDCKLS